MQKMLGFGLLVLFLAILYSLKVSPAAALAAEPTISQGKTKAKTKRVSAKKSAKAKKTATARQRPALSKTDLFPAHALLPDNEIIDELTRYLGTPYRRGGSSPQGMDCSGMVKKVYSETFQMDLPRSSSEQFVSPLMQKVPLQDLQPGDLVFFSHRNRRIGHVGLYLAEGKFVHAASGDGVKISSLDERYWKARMVGARRPVGQEDPGVLGMGKARGVGMAWGDNGLLVHREDTSYDAFSFDRRMPFHVADASHPRALGTSQELFQKFELEYNQVLASDSWLMRLSLLHENVFTDGFEYRGDSLPFKDTVRPGSGEFAFSGYRHGVRMTSDISPVSWLRISPSLSYSEYGNPVQDVMVSGPALGLAVQFNPFPKRWSLSAALHVADERDYASKIFSVSDPWASRDLSVRFGYHVTDAVELQIVGQHGLVDIPSFDASQSLRKDYKGLFLGLDWSF